MEKPLLRQSRETNRVTGRQSAWNRTRSLKRMIAVMPHLLLLLILSCPSFYPCQAAQENQPAPAPPERIVSLGPIITENIYLLGAGERLVGNTSYCVRPGAAREKVKIGSVMQVSIEKVLSLKPDLVLATGLTQPRQLEKLERLGLKVVQFGQPESFAEICSQFVRLGDLLGLEERALQIVDQVQMRVKAIRHVASRMPRQKVFLQVGSRPLFSSVPGSFTHDYIVFSNGSNIAAGQSTGTMADEKVLAEDPDVIIISIMGSETGVAAQERERWLRFSALRAVSRKRVHTISPDLVCSPSPTTFAEALEKIAVLIHPGIELDTAGYGNTGTTQNSLD